MSDSGEEIQPSSPASKKAKIDSGEASTSGTQEEEVTKLLPDSGDASMSRTQEEEEVPKLLPDSGEASMSETQEEEEEAPKLLPDSGEASRSETREEDEEVPKVLPDSGVASTSGTQEEKVPNLLSDSGEASMSETQEEDEEVPKSLADSGEASKSGTQEEDEEVPKLLPEIDSAGLTIWKGRIHKGPSAKSYEGKYFSDPVLVKIFPDDYIDYLLNEATVLSELKHENIVQLVGVGRIKEGYLLITKFLQGGTLKKLLRRCRKGREPPLPLPRAMGYALDIARAMDYVHQQKYIHRDLKSGNVILTDSQDRAVLIDFEISIKENLSGMRGGTRSPFWTAPEMMTEDNTIKQHYDHKVDVFSFSIVLWELITCKIPYQEQPIPKDEILEGIQAHKIRPSMEGIQIPEKLDTLLKSCWAPEAADRPEFSEITTKLEELLQTLHPTETTAPVNAAKEQSGDGQGGDASGSDA